MPDACQAEQCGRCLHAFRPDSSIWMRQGPRSLRQNRVVLRHEGRQQEREGTLSKATMCCAIHVKRTCVYEYCVVLQTLCRLSTKLNISDHAAFATAATHEQYIEALVFAFLSAVRKNQEFNIHLKASQCSTRACELCEVTTPLSFLHFGTWDLKWRHTRTCSCPWPFWYKTSS